MKRIAQLVLGVLAMALVGCQSPQGNLEYKSLKALSVASRTAFNAYGEWYRAKAATTEGDLEFNRTVAEIDRKIDQYQERYELAVKAARFDYQAAAPAELSWFLSELILEIEALK
jgi:hypothetical protein